MSVHFLHPRVFKINVGFMLNAGPGTTHDSTFDFPEVRVSDDLALNYLRGPVRMSRTKEGSRAGRETTPGWMSSACAVSIRYSLTCSSRSRRLFATNPQVAAAFYLAEDAVLDLAPLLREEDPHSERRTRVVPARLQGLCPECGVNRNRETCSCAEAGDPRFAALRQLLRDQQQ
ncbi:MAG: DUF177 domain-containing protein [Chloroflexi bacterium]|nr:DUF177 domain-containing protein [Chloroflexota bacterium]